MKRNRRWSLVLLGFVSLLLVTAVHAQSIKLDKEPACQTLQPAAAGGPVPSNPDVLLVRYLGRANYEVAYRGKVLLLDTYYDNSRLSFGERFGIKESDVTRADAIFVGHTHFDHFGDAPPIAKRTGAPIYLAPPAVKYIRSQGVPDNQIKVVRGGETIQVPGYTVETALAIHMPIEGNTGGAAFHELIAKAEPLTESEEKERTEWRKGESDGTRLFYAEDPLDPEQDTVYHGTIVYVITLDDGFRLLYSDTAGVLSGGERALADSIHSKGGKIDLAILGYLQLGYSLPKAIKTTTTRVKVWDPSIFLPSHFHDGEKSELPEMPTNALFENFRQEAPNTRGIEPLFRTPVCINTKTDDFFVGYYAR
jgi:L-ascorbate metabolism protein UlaG (beta-lactamase superfamily)